MAYPRRDDSTIEEKILSIVKRRPGIDQDALALAIDLPTHIGQPGNTHRNPRVKQILKNMERKGLLRLEKAPHAGRFDPLVVFPVDHKPGEVERPKEYRLPEWLQCRSYRVPLNEIHLYIPKKEKRAS